MKQADKVKRLLKIARTKGIGSPEFKQALKELAGRSKSRPSRRKIKPRGVQTNGKRKKRNEKGSFPPRRRPSEDEV